MLWAQAMTIHNEISPQGVIMLSLNSDTSVPYSLRHLKFMWEYILLNQVVKYLSWCFGHGSVNMPKTGSPTHTVPFKA
jgi:hypothetical protein